MNGAIKLGILWKVSGKCQPNIFNAIHTNTAKEMPNGAKSENDEKARHSSRNFDDPLRITL